MTDGTGKGARGHPGKGAMTPLYRDHRAPDDPFKGDGADANAGLWYDKFCRWNAAGGGYAVDKGAWVGSMAMKVGAERLLGEAVTRLGDLVLARRGHVGFFRAETPLTTGLGLWHPVENGFMWHHTLGTPVLPASGLKGMAREWARTWLRADPADVERVFGPAPDSDRERRVGSVMFFDGLPACPVKLSPDVMTPHYAPYYADETGATPPGDWFDPIPIPFLSVAPATLFALGVAPRTGGDSGDADLAWAWLQEALSTTGFGAKTTSGYGILLLDQTRTDAFVGERGALALRLAMTPLEREMADNGYAGEDFMQALTVKWLARMDEATGPERREIAERLAAWYERHRPEQWRRPSGKNVDKVRRIRSALDTLP